MNKEKLLIIAIQTKKESSLEGFFFNFRVMKLILQHQ